MIHVCKIMILHIERLLLLPNIKDLRINYSTLSLAWGFDTFRSDCKRSTAPPRRRERGRIPVKGVRLVETATVNGEGGDPFAPDGYPFQVGYCESSDDQSQRTVPQYTLYLVANTEKERSDWIYAIRQGTSVKRRRERGRIPVKGVRLVETATVNGEGGDPFAPDGYPFQVGYCESSDDQSQRTVPQYTLYLVANTEKERSDWIYAIRQAIVAIVCCGPMRSLTVSLPSAPH
uniref:PH domain-containing protein n=1 Tax=Glossina austeni TaxID=7395 RepID=A0A1A9VMG6_GLOAU